MAGIRFELDFRLGDEQRLVPTITRTRFRDESGSNELWNTTCGTKNTFKQTSELGEVLAYLLRCICDGKASEVRGERAKLFASRVRCEPCKSILGNFNVGRAKPPESKFYSKYVTQDKCTFSAGKDWFAGEIVIREVSDIENPKLLEVQEYKCLADKLDPPVDLPFRSIVYPKTIKKLARVLPKFGPDLPSPVADLFTEDGKPTEEMDRSGFSLCVVLKEVHEWIEDTDPTGKEWNLNEFRTLVGSLVSLGVNPEWVQRWRAKVDHDFVDFSTHFEEQPLEGGTASEKANVLALCLGALNDSPCEIDRVVMDVAGPENQLTRLPEVFRGLPEQDKEKEAMVSVVEEGLGLLKRPVEPGLGSEGREQELKAGLRTVKEAMELGRIAKDSPWITRLDEEQCRSNTRILKEKLLLFDLFVFRQVDESSHELTGENLLMILFYLDAIQARLRELDS